MSSENSPKMTFSNLQYSNSIKYLIYKEKRQFYTCRLNGERAGTRTQGPLIKSQMLYRLSYTLAFTNEANIHKTCGRVKSFFEKNYFSQNR